MASILQPLLHVFEQSHERSAAESAFLEERLVSSLAEPTSGASLENVQAALDRYQDDPSREQLAILRATLREVSKSVINLSATELEGPKGAAVRETLRTVSASGAHDAPVDEVDLRSAREYVKRGPAGFPAAMLLVGAWQWPDLPALNSVPVGWMSDYVAWMVATPQGFVERGQADLFPERYLLRLEALVRFTRDQSGSPAARDALLGFLRHGNFIPLYFCTGSLRRHYELRAQLLACALARPAVELPATPRVGRRLRVGIINRHFAPQTETYTTLPMFEQLDPERFEVLLFANHATGTPLEKYATSHAAGFTVLPTDLGAQVDVLRAARLDVAVFGTNVTAVFNEVARIALHRVAPLQVVNNSSCTTTGLPEVDLYVSGALTERENAAEHFTERLGLVAGPAHAFNYDADRQEATGAWTRDMLGLPQDAVVFVSAANFFKIIPEMQHAWALLLESVPGSRLLLHPFNPNWSSAYPVKRFAAEFDRVLHAHGVATDRVIISSTKFPSRTDVKELLRVGDIYLDTFPFGGVNSLIDPLELGIPPIVWEGETFRARMGGALLRSLGLEELIATDETRYLALAKTLANDGEMRAALKARIEAGMSRAPDFLDPLAASDAFGALLETTYDELLATRRAAFRANRTPIRVPPQADPLSRINAGVACLEAGDLGGAEAVAREVLGALPTMPAARQLNGALLLRRGAAVRAVDYYLGAVQRVDGDAPLWLDLAFALRESGRTEQAVQALETSLRLDTRYVAAWQMLAELAGALGNQSLAAEARQCVQNLKSADLPQARTKHVLLYTDDPQHGGVAQYNHAILQALTRAGHRATCVQTASESPMVQAQRAAGVRHVWLDYDTGREFGRTLGDGSDAQRIFTAERPDLILFSDCSPVSNLAAREVARTLNIPYVVVVGFVGSYLAKNFAAYLPVLAAQYRAARAVVAVSHQNLDLLRREFGLAAHAGQVIHYGRPAEFFAPRSEPARARLRSELRLPPNAVVCFTAARLSGVKGFAYQLQAAAQLIAQRGGDSLHFVWAGEGEQRGELEREIARLRIGDRVHLLGQRWDVADWYDAADIFVLPSHLEGMPLAIMEAMAKGLPVIATAVSGIPEELGDTGKLLPDPTKEPEKVVSELVDTIARWAGDADERLAAGRRGRSRAEAMFKESLMIERTLGVLAAGFTAESTSDSMIPKEVTLANGEAGFVAKSPSSSSRSAAAPAVDGPVPNSARSLSGDLARAHWTHLDHLYTMVRRELADRRREWRFGPERVLEVAKEGFELSRHHTALAGKVYCELGCGTYHPYGVAAVMFLNGADRTISLDLKGGDLRRASEALGDLILECRAEPERWHWSTLPRSEFLARAHAFDLGALRAGQLAAGVKQLPLSHLLTDIHEPALDPNSIDLMTSRAVLEHFLDFGRAVERLYELMRPGGIAAHLIDLVDHRAYESSGHHYWEFLAEEDAWTDGICNRLRSCELRAHFERVGFEVLHYQTDGGPLPAGFRERVAGRFRAMSDEELGITTVRCVLRKPVV